MDHKKKNPDFSEEEILQLVKQCKEQNPYALEKFFKLFSIDIYNFPTKVFQFDEEQAGDFFLFAFERLRDGKRFKTFKGESTFRTWFYSVLKNLVIDFIRTNQKSKVIQIHNYDNFYEIEKNLPPEYDELETQYIKDKFYDILNDLEFDSRLVFKLTHIFYLTLDEHDLKILKENYHKTNYEIFQFISEAKEYLIEKNTKLNQKEEKLTRLHFKLMALQEKEKRILQNQNREEDRWEIQEKISKKKEIRNSILTKNNEFVLLRVPFYKTAKFLNLSTPIISNLYKKAEKMIKNSEELKKSFRS